jgi:hypothetical protein
VRVRVRVRGRVRVRVRVRVTCGEPMTGRKAAKRRAVRGSTASSYLVRVLGVGVGLGLGSGL